MATEAGASNAEKLRLNDKLQQTELRERDSQRELREAIATAKVERAAKIKAATELEMMLSRDMARGINEESIQEDMELDNVTPLAPLAASAVADTAAAEPSPTPATTPPTTSKDFASTRFVKTRG